MTEVGLSWLGQLHRPAKLLPVNGEKHRATGKARLSADFHFRVRQLRLAKTHLIAYSEGAVVYANFSSFVPGPSCLRDLWVHLGKVDPVVLSGCQVRLGRFMSIGRHTPSL